MQLRQVKFKTWDEMEQEFGLDSAGDIKCLLSFTTGMEDDTPTDRIVTLKGMSWNGWAISKDMIEYEISPSKTQYKTLTVGG